MLALIILDLICTNCPDKFVCSGVRHKGISDHSSVFAYGKLSLHGFPRRHCIITYRNFRKFNVESFRNDITCNYWDHVYNLSNPNDMLWEWKKSFLEIVDEQAPLRKARVRGRGSPWITSELKKQMNERDILKIKAIKSNDPVARAK